jgi:leader peptidase (prepilin peptidase)/N-methyltransferase
VVALRFNTGRSLGGRSACASCARALRWFELIPVISFLIERGRCRSCGSRLSLQYPLVEMVTAAVFLGLFLTVSSIALFLFFAVVFGIYIVIAVYDLRHSIVPDTLSYTAAFLAFGSLFLDWNTLTFIVPSVVDVLAGPALAFPLFFFWMVSGGAWMGLGDAKLMLSIGWILDLAAGSAALLIAFWTGAIYGIALLLYSYFKSSAAQAAGKKRLLVVGTRHTLKHEVPFAPFLVLGFALAFFCDITILELVLWHW